VDDRSIERIIRLEDATRADAGGTVSQLKRSGRRVVLLTGDHRAVARRIGLEAGITETVAGADPAAKVAWIERARRDGHRVLFAGDGLNDGPALAASDIGVAMGTGAASSVLVADGVIATGSLAPLLAGMRAARAANRVIRMNLRFSIAYNVVAVAAAAAGLVNPLVAAVLMPLSSGVIIWGASRVEAAVRRAEA
jgi:P-type E1-E2 ATPase